MALMEAPIDWLHELAKGTIRTQWGDMMKAPDPSREASEKVYNRLKPKYGHSVAFGFKIAAPLLAERLAIAEYKQKNPQIEAVAPEVLSYQEALEIAMRETLPLTTEEKDAMLQLLKSDESMKVIH